MRDYLKEMERSGLSAPTIKQHLAAIRAVFNALMRAGEIEANPAASVKGPRLSVKEGKTPAFDAKEARRFLDAIGTATVKDRRDRALASLMMYSFARVSAAVGMDARDYFQQGDGFHLRLKEKGGKQRTLPAHSALVEELAGYLDGTGLRGQAAPLFQTIDRKTGVLSGRRMSRTDAYEMPHRPRPRGRVHREQVREPHVAGDGNHELPAARWRHQAGAGHRGPRRHEDHGPLRPARRPDQAERDRADTDLGPYPTTVYRPRGSGITTQSIRHD